jgi:hypothetical protein
MKLATCHPSRKASVGDLCGSCYDKQLKIRNPEYKERQLSNTTRWKLKNPEKNAILVKRRTEKARNDPFSKQKARNATLKRMYGIDEEIYQQMLASQNYSCALCFRKPAEGKKLHVDHDHLNKRVRGLLCHQCNWFMGTIDADEDMLARLGLYKYSEFQTYISNQKPVPIFHVD